MKTWHEKDIERLAEFLFENSLDTAENLENAVDVAIMLIKEYLKMEVKNDKGNPNL